MKDCMNLFAKGFIKNYKCSKFQNCISLEVDDFELYKNAL